MSDQLREFCRLLGVETKTERRLPSLPHRTVSHLSNPPNVFNPANPAGVFQTAILARKEREAGRRVWAHNQSRPRDPPSVRTSNIDSIAPTRTSQGQMMTLAERKLAPGRSPSTQQGRQVCRGHNTPQGRRRCSDCRHQHVCFSPIDNLRPALRLYLTKQGGALCRPELTPSEIERAIGGIRNAIKRENQSKRQPEKLTLRQLPKVKRRALANSTNRTIGNNSIAGPGKIAYVSPSGGRQQDWAERLIRDGQTSTAGASSAPDTVANERPDMFLETPSALGGIEYAPELLPLGNCSAQPQAFLRGHMLQAKLSR